MSLNLKLKKNLFVSKDLTTKVLFPEEKPPMIDDNTLKLNNTILAEKIIQIDENNNVEDMEYIVDMILDFKNKGLVTDTDNSIGGNFLNGNFEKAIELSHQFLDNEIITLLQSYQVYFLIITDNMKNCIFSR